MSGFRVALPNPDAVDSWMVKNGLYSFAYGLNGPMGIKDRPNQTYTYAIISSIIICNHNLN